MTDTTYNGWMNYETWRVKLEMFDSCDIDAFWDEAEEKSEEMISAYDLGERLKDCAETHIEESSKEGLARDYALAFLSNVNWKQIAQSLIDAYHDYYEYTHG